MSPLLDMCQQESVAVGLRPCRTTVRLESEIVTHVVHPDPLYVTVFRSDSKDDTGSDINHLIISATSPPTLTTPRVDDQAVTLVVHCYGLGGCGFTIGPGIANDVVKNHIDQYLFPKIDE